MYEYLNGRVVDIQPSYVVLDVAGIGYRLNVANPYRFAVETTTQFYVEQIVRETEMSLYGFGDRDEKALFNQLLNVSGIGPKSALAILASADAAGLIQAVESGDAKYLTQFPGVGKKTAQQIVLDLKGKLGDLANSNGVAIVVEQSATSTDNQALSDALEALLALGYSSRDVAKVEKAMANVQDTTDGYMRQALKLLVKG
jgi:Holliday junction DNA helicase RuvA